MKSLSYLFNLAHSCLYYSVPGVDTEYSYSLSVLAKAKQIISRAAHWLPKPSYMCLLDAFTFLQMQRGSSLGLLSLPVLLPSALNEGCKQQKCWCKVIKESSTLTDDFMLNTAGSLLFSPASEKVFMFIAYMV